MARKYRPSILKGLATGVLFSNLTLIVPLLLSLFGVFMIYESSSIVSARLYEDAFYFIRHQTIWLGIALAVFFVFYHFNYRLLYPLALIFLVGNLVLLLLIFIPGFSTTVLGAKRWLSIGGITLQPSELTKFSLIIYLSAWFSSREKEKLNAFLLLNGFVIGLVMLQPDLGTAVILGVLALFLYFVSGAPIRHFIMLIPTGLAAIFLLSITSSYRFKRLLTFLNPASDPQGIGYHINQINIALSLGGLWGTGFGSSRQKFQFLPEAHTDSIFAIIGENFGFIGAGIIVLAYIIFLVNAYQRIKQVKDPFGFLLSSSIVFLIIAQALINLMAMVQLLPLTGVPLPFISYGGSSLLTFYALLGILLNIFKQVK